MPKSWKLLYRDGDSWKSVVAKGEFETAQDRFIKLDFTPVKTSVLRIEVQLQSQFSGGVLEWQVGVDLGD